MPKKPKGPVGVRVGAGASVTIENSHFEGFETPIHVEPGGKVTARNVTYGKGRTISERIAQSKAEKPAKTSVGWSGREQFDPKQHAEESHPFYGPRLLLGQGANVHTSELESIATKFFAGKPYASVAEIDPKTGEKVYKLKATATPPARMRYVAYSAINDLRNALDQAVSAAASIINGRPTENAYFPFAESPADLDGMLSSKRYADIPDGLKPYIKTLQPYPTSDAHEGGDDLLRALGKIANPNKHQIPLAVGARNLEGVYTVRIRESSGLIEVGDPIWDSAKNELILARTTAEGAFEYDLEMPLYIALGEAGRLTGAPITAVLRELITVVNRIVSGLEAETARIMAIRK